VSIFGSQRVQARDSGVVRPEGSTGASVSDWSLLERVVQRDEAALSALYDRYSGLVFSEAKRILRDTGAAEEILQDLFYQIWRTAERFDAQRGSLAGWLLVAARNRAISRLRRKTGKTEELSENGVSLKVDLESTAAQNILLHKVRTVMGSLPEGQRQAVEFAYFEGMSHTEIAEKTGQPLGTVKTRIRSAMETLKQVLG
jgi:RNA polymerase sigma-70 factor (ECF subfamily)